MDRMGKERERKLRAEISKYEKLPRSQMVKKPCFFFIKFNSAFQSRRIRSRSQPEANEMATVTQHKLGRHQGNEMFIARLGDFGLFCRTYFIGKKNSESIKLIQFQHFRDGEFVTSHSWITRKFLSQIQSDKAYLITKTV